MTIQSEQIAALNDRFRSQFMMPLHFEKFIVPGRVVITSGVTSMTGIDKMEIFVKVCKFDSFSSENDPYGEHDFGAFEHNGRKILW